MKNLKFEFENFPNESLGQVKHIKHVFGVGVGWEFEKMWRSKLGTSEPRPTFPGSYKKESVLQYKVDVCYSINVNSNNDAL